VAKESRFEADSDVVEELVTVTNRVEKLPEVVEAICEHVLAHEEVFQVPWY